MDNLEITKKLLTGTLVFYNNTFLERTEKNSCQECVFYNGRILVNCNAPEELHCKSWGLMPVWKKISIDSPVE